METEHQKMIDPPDPTGKKDGGEVEEVQQEQRRVVGWSPKALDGGYGWIVVLGMEILKTANPNKYLKSDYLKPKCSGSFLIHVFADGFVYSFGVIADSLVEVNSGLN